MRGRVCRDGGRRSRSAATAVKRVVYIAAVLSLGMFLLDRGTGDLNAALNVAAGTIAITVAVHELLRLAGE